MSNRRITWKLAALLAIIAAVAVWSASAPRATGAAQPTRTLDNLDLGSEIQTLRGNTDALRAIEKQLTELHNKSSLTDSEFSSLTLKGNDVKRRLSGNQQAVRSVIEKLKT